MVTSKDQMFLLLMILIASFFSHTHGSAQTVQKCVNPFIDSLSVVVCISVVDGDTWKFKIENDTITVRILNVDCYETRNGSRLDKQATKNGISSDSALKLGIITKKLVSSLILNKQVKMIRDNSQKNFDTYNRLLRRCFVYDTLDIAKFITMQGLNAND